MPAILHHGSPGSTKTTHAVLEGIIPAWKESRLIVTNIRGMSQERCEEVLGKTGAKLYFVSSDSQQELEQWRRFFHFIPPKALIVIDEIQILYSSLEKKTFFTQFDYRGPEQWRPRTLLEAFQKHRHYGWDFIFTAQDFRQVHPEIRRILEGCYRYKNQATVGLPGFVLRYYHPPNNELFEHNKELYRFSSKAKIAWQLFDSVVVDEVKDTQFSESLLKSKKFVFLSLVVIILLILSVPKLFRFFGAMYESISNAGESNNVNVEANKEMVSVAHVSVDTTNIKTATYSAKTDFKDNSDNSNDNTNHVADEPSDISNTIEAEKEKIRRPYEEFHFFINGGFAQIGSHYFMELVGIQNIEFLSNVKSTIRLTYNELSSMGYELEVHNRCAAVMYFINPETEHRSFVQSLSCLHLSKKQSLSTFVVGESQ